MLSLAAPSDPTWVERALSDVDTILLDHAHCEKKAASTAINLIFRYQHRPELMVPLSELAREELEHFEMVISLLKARGIAFKPLAPSPYAKRLRSAARDKDPERLLDILLCCAIIEGRSCERMKILSENLADQELCEFYKGLLACEARHHHVYVEMAMGYFDRDVVKGRLEELARHEAEVLAGAPVAVRLHN